MAKEIYLSGNYVVVTDANNVDRVFPIGKTVYTETSGNFLISEGQVEREQLIIPVSDAVNWVDNDGTNYTESTFRDFLRTNTGSSSLSSGVSGASWGGITGTLSDQTDLQDELDDKQDTLVSATNIKTINGASVLGSGDLTVGGGGGAPATHVLTEPRTGFFYSVSFGFASNLTTIGSGQLMLSAFTPGYDLEIDAISFVQVSTALAGGLLKVVIYSSANGQPNTKLFESATVSADTTGNKLLTGLNFTFNANETYWISTVSNGNIGLRAYNNNQDVLFPIIAHGQSTQAYSAYYYPSTFNNLPATMPTLSSGYFTNNRIPCITFRKS
ncbi:hypothetical protein N9D22_05715 [Flavobacteriaceae bacterium]|nr:hypothetical protein [Flavobacteriaceae bacterium]